MLQANVTFPNISPRAWEHPADRAALRSLRSVPGFDTTLRWFVGNTTERSLRLLFLASSVRVNERQFPRVYELTQQVCRILDVKEMPEVYIVNNPTLNAAAWGVDKPFITLNSALVSSLSDEELAGVIGHEVGHILSGHVLYKTLLRVLIMATQMIAAIPLTGLALYAVIAALKEWDRKSELSADRAELLVTQNLQQSIHTHMKLAGGPQLDQMSMEEFLKQAEEYEAINSTADNFYKTLNLLWQSHPFVVHRVGELKRWVESGAYQEILNGNYPTGGSDGFDEMKRDFSEASEGYRDDLRNTTKPIEDLLKDAGKVAEEAADKAKDFLKGIFKN